MRSILTCLVALAAAAGCAHPDNPGPTLTITPSDPSGTVTIGGPTNFSAVISNTTAEETVTWTVSGGGTISTTTGLHTVFAPALGLAPPVATLTAATADGLTATVTIASGPAVLTSDTIPNLLAPVTVLTDPQDIPHIRCATQIDCFAVQGYIHARDRFFMMDFLRHVARAHLAELIGVDGVSQDVQIRTLFVTRSGQRIEDALSANADPATKAILDAYTGGVNAYLSYLRAHPSEMPGEYKQLPFPITPADVTQWSDEDTLAMARLQQFQLSETLSEETGFATFAQAFGPTTARFRAWIRSAAPAGEQAHTLSATAHTGVVARTAGVPSTNLAALGDGLKQLDAKMGALRDLLRPYDASVGSNNWVISAAMSATHQAMVANDPHLSLQYPPLFHLSVMTSALASDHLDLAGGAFPGIPGALVGRGQHVGWGVTVVGYDVTDVYQESLSPCAPAGCVAYNGVPEPLIVIPQTFMVRTAAGLVNAPTIPGISVCGTLPTTPICVPAAVAIAPHHGPIIQQISAGVALSVRWTGQEGNTQDLRGILGLNTAADVDAAILALKDFSTGAQNFVLADDQGHIAYDPHALVPVRNFADPTKVGLNVQAPWFPLKGYDGSAEWGDGVANCASAGATPVPASCWISDDVLPHGKDPAKGYYMTANADPTANGVTDGNSPLDPANQPYLSFDWDDSSGFRATRIQERIEAAIASNGSVSEADMESIQSDHVSRPGKFFATYIAGMPTTNDTANLTAAKAILAKWSADGWDCPSGLTGSDPNNSGIDTSGTVVDDSAGCFLFHAFLRDLFTNVFTDDLKVVGQGVNQLQAMKAMMYMLTTGTADQDFCGTANGAGAVTPKSCDAQIVTALAQAYAQVSGAYTTTSSQWKWGKVHTMQPVSLLALITTNYEPGPYARPGGAFTVDVGTPSTASAGLEFPFGSSGNVRHISVMNPTAPVTKMQLPGPEKDGPVLFGGPDLLGQWVLNKYFDFAIGTQVDAVTVSTQTFTAH